ncbi:NACHT and WD repeat domain-containing protein 2 [Trichonephila clavipes]|nr:NACHT and WD repeat domain-containing protein 2 [Trichonephila clavipes]
MNGAELSAFEKDDFLSRIRSSWVAKQFHSDASLEAVDRRAQNNSKNWQWTTEDHDDRIHVRRYAGECCLPECVIEWHNGLRLKVMIWGAILYHG